MYISRYGGHRKEAYHAERADQESEQEPEQVPESAEQSEPESEQQPAEGTG
jgi:hypothetical protein